MVIELKPRIVVFGVGGAGGNAVNNMIESDLQGVDFIVANTDSQALLQTKADSQIQLGVTVTEGLGAGAQPSVGAAAAEESIQDIENALEGAHMVFVAAGMGGGTGTGAAPIIAKAARAKGILTVGVVTKPFDFEGRRRMTIAEGGVDELRDVVDTLIIIPNQNLFRIANAQTTLSDAFTLADDVLHAGVRGITDLMVMPGLINLDFADVKTVMQEMGAAMMGTGEADGEDRSRKAAEAAINNPLLDDVSMRGAKGVLINITGGDDMTLYEVDEAANLIRAEVDPDAQIILGSAFNPNMNGKLRVSVVATGIIASAYAEGVREPKTEEKSEEQARGWIDPAAETPSADMPATAPEAEPETGDAEVESSRPVIVTGQASTETLNEAEPEQESSDFMAQKPIINPRPAVMDEEHTIEEAPPVAPVAAESTGEPVAAEAPVSPQVPNPPPFMPEPEVRADDAALETEKTGFSGLFGWRRNSNTAENTDNGQAGDELDEEDLEIPAFLRRSANN